MSLDIFEAFSKKTVFVTGGSGFMGKVLLFKLLKEFPDIETIYVLIRGKKSRKFKRFLGPQERLEKEILSSLCFEPLKSTLGEDKFKSLCKRVIAVEGNITDDRLGLCEKNCKKILESVNFVIHVAATVNFDEPLNVAVETNTLGSLRVLALAKQCRKLEAMVHISTCYVNYNLEGSIVEECLYPLPFDPEAMCKYILALHDNEVDMVTEKLLKKYGFPNTYTFTKAMGEHLIRASRGNCPISIVRPSIVGCSFKEPFPGWVDALTAAGGLLLTSGLGVVQEINGREDAIADIVPVDFVVNTIIKALFKTQLYVKSQRVDVNVSEQSRGQEFGSTLLKTLASPESFIKKGSNGIEGGRTLTSISLEQQQQQQQQQQDGISSVSFTRSDVIQDALPFVFHAATSSSVNHLTWRRLRDATKYYWDWKKRHPRAIAPMRTELIESQIEYLIKFFFRRELPYQVLRCVSMLPPPIGSEEKRQLVKKLGKAVFRAKDLNRQFQAFTSREWIFSTVNTKSLDDGLNDHSRQAFYFDTYMINWWFYAHAYSHGMLKYIVNDTGDYTFPKQPETPTDIFKRASSL
ncbi:fatty acyl-CoA reductase [Trypanosoma theileri]|uniref:Fatty acyl-CoA reductase n=1 Tax=Trypanosoma theileri TaxID=67003 RepID=A0A1X0NVR7_9TRYP|nr:fatty acyl-CoA reductase [Trypanosoma theileri]ORC88806.1 fatty acyl-CoA reductase [Trypanosoma theileri]